MIDQPDTADDLLPPEFPELTANDATPPHGDELRSEVNSGRSDRETNADNEAEAGHPRQNRPTGPTSADGA